MTNFERVKLNVQIMTMAEMADKFSSSLCNYISEDIKEKYCRGNEIQCEKCVKEWLGSEVDVYDFEL